MAEALFREGKKLLANGKIDDACAKFESSYHLDEVLGTLLNLASCHETQGRLATAWGEFNEALTVSKKADLAARQKFAKEHIAAIEPKLSHLTVTVPDEVAVEGFQVTLDRLPLPRGAWGTAVPVDSGSHAVIATAPGRRAWESSVKLEQAASESVRVPALVVLPPPPPPPSAPSPSLRPTPPRSRWKRPVGIGALGVGAVGIGVGSYFGARALGLGSESARGCQPDGSCTGAAYDAFTRGKTAATMSDVFLIVGGAMTAAGSVVLILDTVDKPSAPRPGVSLGPGSLIVTGAF
ncbi:MAG: tetratricopeptide repeat protein [Byssovorax sp.]